MARNWQDAPLADDRVATFGLLGTAQPAASAYGGVDLRGGGLDRRFGGMDVADQGEMIVLAPARILRVIHEVLHKVNTQPSRGP